ncbi:hypothetical protein TrCOL_g2683 [Triparma columacea]|uniref:Uncharacterized protein n=1 Tax=Triparma columacea TaxID=722753 RepID=A0A9W7GGG7_9STRA|nr:hypothetical protein TrCOL_g2683 [Triparma columacea]
MAEGINGGALYWGSTGSTSPGSVAGGVSGMGSGSLESSAFLFRDGLEGEVGLKGQEGDEGDYSEDDYGDDDEGDEEGDDGVGWREGWDEEDDDEGGEGGKGEYYMGSEGAEEWDKENAAVPSLGGIDMAAVGDGGEESEVTPRMDEGFYKSFESLLNKPPPTFGLSSSSVSTKKTTTEIRRNKSLLRKLELKGTASSVVPANVKSKIDTGNIRKSSTNKSKVGGVPGVVPGSDINPSLLAEAFAYASRCAAVEALDNMDGTAALRAKEVAKNGGGVFVGNPVSVVRGVRGGSGGKGGGRGKGGREGNDMAKGVYGGGGGGVLINRSNSAGGIGVGGKKKKRGGGKQSKGGMVTGGGKGGKGKKGDMERLLMQLSSGGEVERLKRELEESQRNVESSKDFLRNAAGEFMRGGMGR